MTRAQLYARIAGLLGGRVAEEAIFGSDEVTTGAGNDIEKITYLARQMVTKFGMSELGPLALEEAGDNNYAGMDWGRRSEHSEAIAAKIDRLVREIVEDCHQRVRQIIEENRVAIDRLVDRLIDCETIEGEEFRQLLESYQVAQRELAPSC
jgi:cell division protease FtsH